MNLQVLRLAFTTKQIRNRILFVVGMIVVFRFLAHVPIPTDDPQALRDVLKEASENSQLASFLNLLSGGALTNYAIVYMGLGPYINASIIFQVLVKVVPQLGAIQKEGESGRKKINQYTRLLSIPIAIGQAIISINFIRTIGQGVEISFLNDITYVQWFVMVTALVAGSTLLMWIGELISERGVGNGISLLIFAGIVSQFPGLVNGVWQLAQTNSDQARKMAIFGALVIVIIYALVKLNEGQRKITVSYAKRVQGSKTYGGVESTIPIKVITAGVIPVIFAFMFLSAPGFLGQLLTGAESQWLSDIGTTLQEWFGGNTARVSNVYIGTLFTLVIALTYAYTNVVFNAKELAENLQKQGAFIPGIRPGKNTEQYLRRVINRITLFGSLSLAALAIMPFIAERLTNTPLVLSLTGTALLIMVSVALETLRQLESQALTSTYE